MDVRFLGTGGVSGWPEPGCRCASCLRAAAAGRHRSPAAVLVDGTLRLEPGRPPRHEGQGAAAPLAAAAGRQPAAGGYRIEAVPGGWDITAPDGARLLAAAGPGDVPDPPPGTAPFDLVLLDLLDAPMQLGGLRARGLVRAGTAPAFLAVDHRVASEAELARRARLWRALAPADGATLTIRPGRPVPWAVPDDPPLRTLILGGARSGKSREAELRLAAEPRVTYLAAGPWADDSWAGADGSPDEEWAGRVAAHRARRPPWWRTVEGTDVAGALSSLCGAVLIDGIGTWLAAVMDAEGAWDPASADAAAGRLRERVNELVAAWRQAGPRVVAVSDQVGSGVVPATSAGRQFRDQLGWLNQRLAAESEQALLVIAGRVLDLPT